MILDDSHMATAPIAPNSFAGLQDAQIAAKGFREYDARWRYPEDMHQCFSYEFLPEES